MSQSPTPSTESQLRSTLVEAVNGLRTVMNRMPVPLNPDSDTSTVDEALQLLVTAEQTTAALSALAEATEEAALLACTSRASLAMIRHSLTLLCAEMDSRSAA